MYTGHFAIGLAMKSASPKTPALPIMIGVGLLDIVDGLLILAGLDKVTPDLHSGPYLFFDLTFVDWDHSLLMAAVLSVIWGLFFFGNRKTALMAAIAAFSHFVADWPVHNDDLALYPHSAEHIGLGLWGRLGTTSWVLEGAFCVLLATYAYFKSKARGVNLIWPVAFLLFLFFQLSPWTSPMKFVAQLDEPAAHLIHGALVTIGFLLPGSIFTALINRAERLVKKKPIR